MYYMCVCVWQGEQQLNVLTLTETTSIQTGDTKEVVESNKPF